jgi:hypothetical protein
LGLTCRHLSPARDETSSIFQRDPCGLLQSRWTDSCLADPITPSSFIIHQSQPPSLKPWRLQPPRDVAVHLFTCTPISNPGVSQGYTRTDECLRPRTRPTYPTSPCLRSGRPQLRGDCQVFIVSCTALLHPLVAHCPCIPAFPAPSLIPQLTRRCQKMLPLSAIRGRVGPILTPRRVEICLFGQD